jgi:hypothetical protein
MAGKSMLVVGDTDHGGLRHLIIRNPEDGTKCLLPEWMTLPKIASLQIVSCPRIALKRLVELRALIDRLMVSSSGQHLSGGKSNETLDATPTGSVRKTTAARTRTASTGASSETANNTPQGSDAHNRRKKRRGGQEGGDQ